MARSRRRWMRVALAQLAHPGRVGDEARHQGHTLVHPVAELVHAEDHRTHRSCALHQTRHKGRVVQYLVHEGGLEAHKGAFARLEPAQTHGLPTTPGRGVASLTRRR